MRKLALALILALLLAAIPSVSFTEDTAAVRLARTIYALAADESYETKLALGSVVMNRVAHPLYPDTLSQVLSQAQQFPCGSHLVKTLLRDEEVFPSVLFAGTRRAGGNRSREADILPALDGPEDNGALSSTGRTRDNDQFSPADGNLPPS